MIMLHFMGGYFYHFAIHFDHDGLGEFFTRDVSRSCDCLCSVGGRVRDTHVSNVVAVQELLESLDRHDDLLCSLSGGQRRGPVGIGREAPLPIG